MEIVGPVQKHGMASWGFTKPQDIVDSGDKGCALPSQVTELLELLTAMQFIELRGFERLNQVVDLTL